jgi:hypothetical protein
MVPSVANADEVLPHGSLASTGAVAAKVETAVVAPAAVAPACVRLEQWETQDIKNKEWNSWAKMENTCFQTFTVRMIWSWARDGDCRILDPGSSWTEGRFGPHPSVSELRRC